MQHQHPQSASATRLTLWTSSGGAPQTVLLHCSQQGLVSRGTLLFAANQKSRRSSTSKNMEFDVQQTCSARMRVAFALGSKATPPDAAVAPPWFCMRAPTQFGIVLCQMCKILAQCSSTQPMARHGTDPCLWQVKRLCQAKSYS